MPFCAAVGCTNHLNNKTVSFHILPKNKALRRIWIEKINRVDLPVEVYICSDHFESSMFDQSHEMRQRLLPESSKSRIKHKLCKGAYPTIFSHNPTPKPRTSSKSRIEKAENAEIVQSLLDQTIEKNNPAEQLESSIPNGMETANDIVEPSAPCVGPNDELLGEKSTSVLSTDNYDFTATEINVESPENYYRNRNLICVATQTENYTKDAMTSTALRPPCKLSHKKTQTNPKLKTAVNNVSYQFPTPKKKTKKFKRKWKSRQQLSPVPETVSQCLSDILDRVDSAVTSSSSSLCKPTTKLNSQTNQELRSVDFETNADKTLSNEAVISNQYAKNNQVDNTGVLSVNSNVESVNSNAESVNSNVRTVNINVRSVNSEFQILNSDNPIVNKESINHVHSQSKLPESKQNLYEEIESESDTPSSEPDAGALDTTGSLYEPSSPESESDIESEKEVQSEKEVIRNKRTLLVYESKLLELLRFCPQCGGHVDRSVIKEVANTGSQFHLKFSCFNNCKVEWKSQPCVGKMNGLGNLFLATSICFSGIPFAKFERFAWLVNLKFVSDSTYYQIRRDYILPIVKRKWKKERKRMVELLKQRDLVVLVGDGRCDSPGHSAKYCTYTFMETTNGEVIDTVVVPVTKVKNSNAMEKEGFVRIVDKLKKAGVKIDMISTDRHIQIRHLMRVDPKYNDITHEFDPWHIIKGVVKKINAATKKKSRECLIEWMPSIVNHFWWCISASNGDSALLYEKFSSLIYHTVNRHEWPGCKFFKRCAHERLTEKSQRETKWLKEGSESHEFLVSIIRSKALKNDLAQVSHAIRTTNVEVFNNLLLKYLPKQYHFEYDHMLMGTYLAALEHNFNSWRKQDVIKTGENAGKLKYSIAWRKPAKKFIPRKIYEKKHYDVFKVLMSGCYKEALKGKKRKSLKRVMAPRDCDSKEEILQRARKQSRF